MPLKKEENKTTVKMNPTSVNKVKIAIVGTGLTIGDAYEQAWEYMVKSGKKLNRPS